MQTDERPRTQTRYSPSIHQILYLYTCKTLSKTPNFVELQRKIEWQC